MNDLLEKIRQLMALTLGVPPDSITDSTSTETLSEWTSLQHLNLIMAIESEFGVFIPPDTTLELTSVAKIVEFLESNPT